MYVCVRESVCVCVCDCEYMTGYKVKKVGQSSRPVCLRYRQESHEKMGEVYTTQNHHLKPRYGQ